MSKEYTITLNGRYNEVQYRTISKIEAINYIENGVNSDSFEEIDSDSGLTEGYVYCNDELVFSFSYDKLKNKKNINKHGGKGAWHILREESGRIFYSPMKINGPFNPNKLKLFLNYEYFNGYQVPYVLVEYDGQQFEFGHSEPKFISSHIVDDSGQLHDFILNEDEDIEDDIHENITEDEFPIGVKLKNQALLLYDKGDIESAISMMREAFKIHLDIFSPADTYSINITNSLASMLTDSGKKQEAYEILQFSLNKIGEIKGEYSYEYSKTCGWIARNLNSQGRWTESLKFSERYLIYFNEPDRWYDLAYALEKLGRINEAKTAYEEALSYNDDELNPNIARILNQSLFEITKGSDESKKYLEAALEFARKSNNNKWIQILENELIELNLNNSISKEN